MYVFSNLATSLDGKIATPSRELYALGTPEDRRQMQVLRSRSDVVLFGASSLRAFKKPCIVSGPLAIGRKRQPANAVLSRAMEGISPDWPFFKRPGFHRILLVSDKAKGLGAFEKSCEIVPLKNSGAKHIIQALEERGYRSLLVEGGGSVMWEFARENLIEEYNVTLTPKVIGGTESPTLVDGEGFNPSQVLNLKLISCIALENELYLKYLRTKRRG